MENIDLAFLHEFEKVDLGYEPKDLEGKAFLKSNLVPFQHYLEKWSQKQIKLTDLLTSMPLSAWTNYPKFLIDHFPLERNDFQLAIQRVIDFVIWLKDNHTTDLSSSHIQMALKYGQKEIERGLVIQRHLKTYLEKIARPSMQSYDLNSIELELSWLQFKDGLESTEPYYGEYEVISKDSDQNKVFFQSSQNDKKVVLDLPEQIFEQIQKGDHFHFEYEETEEQHQRFKNIEFIFPEVHLEG